MADSIKASDKAGGFLGYRVRIGLRRGEMTASERSEKNAPDLDVRDKTTSQGGARDQRFQGGTTRGELSKNHALQPAMPIENRMSAYERFAELMKRYQHDIQRRSY